MLLLIEPIFCTLMFFMPLPGLYPRPDDLTKLDELALSFIGVMMFGKRFSWNCEMFFRYFFL